MGMQEGGDVVPRGVGGQGCGTQGYRQLPTDLSFPPVEDAIGLSPQGESGYINALLNWSLWLLKPVRAPGHPLP